MGYISLTSPQLWPRDFPTPERCLECEAAKSFAYSILASGRNSAIAWSEKKNPETCNWREIIRKTSLAFIYVHSQGSKEKSRCWVLRAEQIKNSDGGREGVEECHVVALEWCCNPRGSDPRMTMTHSAIDLYNTGVDYCAMDQVMDLLLVYNR